MNNPFSRSRREKSAKAGHIATGQAGEDAAAALLKKLGWKILDRNWRKRPLELDLVCLEGDVVVFVEVKTRRMDSLARPDESFNAVKRSRVVRAASAWLTEHDKWSSPCRFDLIVVRRNGEVYHAELMRNVIELDASGGNAVGRGHSAWQPW